MEAYTGKGSLIFSRNRGATKRGMKEIRGGAADLCKQGKGGLRPPLLSLVCFAQWEGGRLCLGFLGFFMV